MGGLTIQISSSLKSLFPSSLLSGGGAASHFLWTGRVGEEGRSSFSYNFICWNPSSSFYLDHCYFRRNESNSMSVCWSPSWDRVMIMTNGSLLLMNIVISKIIYACPIKPMEQITISFLSYRWGKKETCLGPHGMRIRRLPTQPRSELLGSGRGGRGPGGWGWDHDIGIWGWGQPQPAEAGVWFLLFICSQKMAYVG